MSSPKKPRLDFHPSSVDIISKLIDRQLEHIIEDILSYLSEMDIANAVTANPEWSAVATSRTRLKRLFSRNKEKTAPLKTFYRREELLAGQTQDHQIETYSLFLEACKKYSNLANKARFESTGKQTDFQIVFPLEDAIRWNAKTIHINDGFIVTVLNGLPKATLPGRRNEDYHYFIQLYDRWTFQLVNSLSVKGSLLELHVFDGPVNSVFLDTIVRGKRRASLWDFTTGKLHALHCPAPIYRTFCIAKLMVLAWRNGRELSATVYKVHHADGSGSIATRIVDREPLEVFHILLQIPSAEDLDYFAIGALIDHADSNFAFQLRSKEDFTLLRSVLTTVTSPSHYANSFLLSEHFLLIFNDAFEFEYSSADVVSLQDGNLRTVYRFLMPKEMICTSRYSGIVTKVGQFLVLYFERSGELDTAIWKLPSDFIETCHRHLKEESVGVTSKCDQLICETNAEKRHVSKSIQLHSRFDRFGVLRCDLYRKGKFFESPAVVHVTMLNSIISDEESF